MIMNSAEIEMRETGASNMFSLPNPYVRQQKHAAESAFWAAEKEIMQHTLDLARGEAKVVYTPTGLSSPNGEGHPGLT